MWAEYRARAMGTDVQIVVPSGDEDVLGAAARRLDDLERRWSRFLPRSELTRLNSHPGVPVIVSIETFNVIALAIDAWRATEGRFDPTIHDALTALGYDRSFDRMPQVAVACGEPGPSPSQTEIELDMALSAITLPVGVRLDLGGIGKGAAADLIVAESRAAGGRGICVNIGGDARAWGEGPTHGSWSAVLRCPGSHETRPVELVDGAVCTSTRLRRRWHTRAGLAHHLIDPATGRSANTGVASVGVVAAGAAQAEILAKVAFLAGPDAGLDLLHRHGVEGVIVTDDGRVHDVGLLTRSRPHRNPPNPGRSADGTHRD